MKALVALLLLVSAAHAQTVPPLTGRVVDTGDMLTPATEAALTARLAAFEDSTSTQIVVLTVPTLGGGDLERFATDVVRTWGIGQRGADNGALLLVARDDRTLRIEVGYGLEGDLTDARAATIIRTVIVPRLRDGDPDSAVSAGVDAMIASLDGTGAFAPLRSEFSRDVGALGWLPRLLIGALFTLVPVLILVRVVQMGSGDAIMMALPSALLGLFVAIGLVVATGRLALLVLAVLVPLVAVQVDAALERDPVRRERRRVRRRAGAILEIRAQRHARVFATARARGETHVVIDGIRRRVPDVSSSSGGTAGGSSGGRSSGGRSWSSSSGGRSSGFSGGGGSSGGGGASGSW